MGAIKDKEYISAGVYGMPQTVINDSMNRADYKLQVMLWPAEYMWKLIGIDSFYRANLSTHILPRGQYFIEYSNGINTGTVGYFLEDNTVVNIRCEES